MTIKEQLHQIVDELDDEGAVEVLAFAQRASARRATPARPFLRGPEPGVDADRESLWQVARPLTSAVPLWSIVGLLDDDGSADMSSDGHRYLAAIYAELHDE